MDNDLQKIYARMARLCSLREQCRSDIYGKLEKLGVPRERADEIIAGLCNDKYIDELRYARAFVHDKSSIQGWGIARIKLVLQRKGLPQEAVAAAIEDIDCNKAEERLMELMEAKWKSLSNESDPLRKQAKLYRFALGRGYGYDQIKKAYDTVRTI